MPMPVRDRPTNYHGDIYYVRSTDNGNTWSTPIKLNDDPGGQFKTQWMPSLSVNYSLAGFSPVSKVTVSWYDRRQATSACNVATDPGCSYYRYGIQSADNGATWGSNIQISDTLIRSPPRTTVAYSPAMPVTMITPPRRAPLTFPPGLTAAWLSAVCRFRTAGIRRCS